MQFIHISMKIQESSIVYVCVIEKKKNKGCASGWRSAFVVLCCGISWSFSDCVLSLGGCERTADSDALVVVAKLVYYVCNVSADWKAGSCDCETFKCTFAFLIGFRWIEVRMKCYHVAVLWHCDGKRVPVDAFEYVYDCLNQVHLV